MDRILRIVSILFLSCYWAIAQDIDTKCECVFYYLCDDGVINTNGKYLIEIRSTNECDSFMEVCCNKTSSISASTTTPSPPIPKNVKKTSGCGHHNPDGIGFRIMGNTETQAQFGEFPWMVAVMKKQNDSNYEYVCGGSLIHPQVVLTAAHCVRFSDTQFAIRAGEWDMNNTKEIFRHQDIDVDTTILHPEFYFSALHNNIALLFLKTPVILGETINVVCLPSQNSVKNDGRCFVNGWGKNIFAREDKRNSVLKKIDIPIFGREKCQNDFRKTRLGKYFRLHKSLICAGGEKGKDACIGDGGGPLSCPISGSDERYEQTGIVAWGIGCGEENIPGAYTNVAHFRNWIDKELEKKNYDTSVYQHNI